MLRGVRTCPGCKSRVIPASDDTCPSCRSYKFVGAEHEIPPPPSPADLAVSRHQLRVGATLHRRLVLSYLALSAVMLFRVLRPLLASDDADVDSDPIGSNWMFLAVFVVASVAASICSAALQQWLATADPRRFGVTRWNVFKHSRAYFEERGIGVTLFGPELDEADQDEGA